MDETFVAVEEPRPYREEAIATATGYVFTVRAADIGGMLTEEQIVASRATVDCGHLMLTLDPHGTAVAVYAPGRWASFTRTEAR
jgi:hypothetical protein